ncbi:MAG: hypothetical protein V4454_14285 [Pseudomonadota bacterium]
MKQATSSDELIEIRGRIYARHPSYDRCRSAKEGTAFKTLLDLADQAVIASNRLAQMVEAGHPLHPTLSGMKSAEAITYLLGVTQKYMQQAFLFPGDKNAVASSDQLAQQLVTPNTGVHKTDPPGARVEISSGKTLDLDDETFDAFSSFTAAQN